MLLEDANKNTTEIYLSRFSVNLARFERRVVAEYRMLCFALRLVASDLRVLLFFTLIKMLTSIW